MMMVMANKSPEIHEADISTNTSSVVIKASIVSCKQPYHQNYFLHLHILCYPHLHSLSGPCRCGAVLVHNGRASNLLEERNNGLALVWADIFTPGCDRLILSMFQLNNTLLMDEALCCYNCMDKNIFILLLRGDWISQTGCFFGKLPNGL